MHVVVLGAGLAGLAAALELARAGARVTVVEREAHVGGMAHSWRREGHWLDFGPHRFHTRNTRLLAELSTLLDGRLVERERRSRILLGGRWFDYPLSAPNVLANLPAATLARALWDYAAVRLRNRFGELPERDFESWVTKRFGRTLYELFFGTYTEKAWGLPCSRISSDWAAQRISQADLWDTIHKTLRPPREGTARSLVRRFHYPETGGIGALARAFRAEIERLGGTFELATRVTRVETAQGRARRVHALAAHGAQAFDCDALVSTIPLPALACAVDPALEPAARAAAAALEHVAIVFVYLELARPALSADHWTYLPERHLAVHRVSEPKNFSAHGAPPERTAICCEITCRPGDATWSAPPAELARRAIDDLARAGLAQAGELRALDQARLPEAYPVYDLDYAPRVAALQAAVARLANVVSTGRQGRFRYNNMDQSLLMGRKAARELVAGHDPVLEAELGLVEVAS